MALELIVDALDSVPEALRGEYAEKDGKYHLNVNGIEDTTGLKTALQKERENNKKAAATAKALEEKVKRWEGLGKTDTEIADMLEKAATAETEALKKSGNFDALLADTKTKAAATLAAEMAKWNAEKAELAADRDAARNSERTAIIETSVTGALTKAKATAEGLDLLTERLGRRISFTMEDGARVIQIMQADGKSPMAGSGAGGTATYDDLVKEAKTTWPSLFEGSGAGGGGKSPKDAAGGSGGKTISRADFDKLGPFEQAAKIKSGVIPVD